MNPKVEKDFLKRYLGTEVILFAVLVIFEFIHVRYLFQNYDFLAGGDNYTWLKVISKEVYPYVWDNTLSLGGRTVSMPNLLGIPLYSYIFSFLSPKLLQRILIFSLYLLKYIAFVKLAKLVSKKLSIPAILPAILLFTFNAYESLNPFSLFPLIISIYLPLSLYYFIKILDNTRIDYVNISKLIFFSVVFSTLNSNLALSITVFIPQIVYLLIRVRSLNKAKVTGLVIYYVVVFITSLWWFLPLANYYSEVASGAFTNNWFSAIDAGQLSQNYRFIGQWGWYTGSYLYPYYPFSTYYDNPFILLITYSTILMAFFGGFIHEKERRLNVMKSLFLVLAFLSLFLIGGSRAPFGSLYEMSFLYIKVLKIFREPFTKFSEIYVMSISILFYFFLLYLEQKLIGIKRYLAFLLIFLVVIFSVKPSLVSEHVWSKWNGSMRSFRIDIPEYWLELKDYVDKNIENSRILSFPKSNYGSAWNWVNGFSSADDVSINFINNKNMVLRNPLPSGSGSGKMVDKAYEQEFLTPKYFTLLGVDYVLLENDLDFRYAGNVSYTPSKGIEILNNMDLEKPVNFGNFTREYISKIQNDEIDKNTKYEANYELLGKPQLSLYKVKDSNKSRQFFPSADHIFVEGDESDIKKITSFNDYQNNSAIFLSKNGQDMIKNPDSVFISGVRKNPQVLINELEWNPSWRLLDSDISPTSLAYIFIRIDEFLHKLYSKGDVIGNIDTSIMLSVKRVNEIDKYKLGGTSKNKAITNMKSNILSAIKSIQSVPLCQRDNRYWEEVKKAISFVKSNEVVLGNYADSSVYLDFVKWVENNTNSKCQNFCYEFVVPVTGEYEIYIDKETFDRVGYKEIKIENTNTLDDINTKEKFWNKIGRSSLKKGLSYRAELLLNDPKNLLKSGEWESLDGVNNRNDFIRDFFPDNYIPWYGYVFSKDKSSVTKVLNNAMTNNNVKFKYIVDWSAGNRYKLSFDYKVEKGGLGISVVEDYLNYSEMYKKIYGKSQEVKNDNNSGNYISRVLYQKEFDLNSLVGEKRSCDNVGICTYHFEDTINSSRNAKGAKLFFYSFSGIGDDSSISLGNIRVEEVIEPNVVLKYTNENSFAKEENPKIEYKRINPTKYILNVRGAVSPFTLVFNESFSKDWKLVYRGKLVVPESKHHLVNGYANAWEIDPSYMNNNKDYSLEIEFSSQKYFETSFALMLLIFISISFIIFINLIKRVRK